MQLYYAKGAEPTARAWLAFQSALPTLDTRFGLFFWFEEERLRLEAAFWGPVREAAKLLQAAGMLDDLDPTVTYTEDESDVVGEYPHGVRLQQKDSFYQIYEEVGGAGRSAAPEMGSCKAAGCPRRGQSSALGVPPLISVSLMRASPPRRHRQSAVFWSNSIFGLKDTPWADKPYTGTKEQKVRRHRGGSVCVQPPPALPAVPMTLPGCLLAAPCLQNYLHKLMRGQDGLHVVGGRQVVQRLALSRGCAVCAACLCMPLAPADASSWPPATCLLPAATTICGCPAQAA